MLGTENEGIMVKIQEHAGNDIGKSRMPRKGQAKGRDGIVKSQSWTQIRGAWDEHEHAWAGLETAARSKIRPKTPSPLSASRLGSTDLIFVP